MRQVPAAHIATWRAGDFVGATRPRARITVQRGKVRHFNVPQNLYTSYLFGNPATPKELDPNAIKRVHIERATKSPIASCTVTLANVLADDPDAQTVGDPAWEPGGLHPQYGTTGYASRWGHAPNVWRNMLRPDNILRTFEGYGWNLLVPPEDDANLLITGVWRIDDVDFGADGLITIECRDWLSIFTDQIAFPPVVPFSAGPRTADLPKGKYAYPVQFQAVNPAPTVSNVPLDPQRISLRAGASSNDPYTSDPYRGHTKASAFDGNPDTYWLSIGNPRPDQGYSFEWIEGNCGSTTVSSVRFRTRGTGYTAFVSVYANGQWQGVSTVPYQANHPFSAPNGADVKYLQSTFVPDEGWQEVTLDTPIANATRVRVCLTNLWNSGIDSPDRPWRGAFREIQAFGGQLSERVTTTYDLANYDDYVDIVKLFLAWGGFWWPTSANSYIKHSDGSTNARNWTREDKAVTIAQGRVWGDFKLSGTYGPATLGVDVWDKKPLLDCIQYVADILGYLFYVDEEGGVVFRPPNIYAVGNLLRTDSRAAGTRTFNIPVIDEQVTLVGLSSRLSGKNLRERVFISNTDGTAAHIAAGWNPNPIGLRRVGGWTDQGFQTKLEAKIMAEMITFRQVMTYRSDTVTIPANLQIQPDDQVRILERITTEGFVHYVESVTSDNDLEAGQWTMQLGTQWLGETPFTRWAFDRKQLSRELRAYLNGLYDTAEDGA